MMIPFSDRLGKAVKNGGFRLRDYWVWCGSAVRGDDDLYHLYASRIPKSLPFAVHWVTNSEIVHAVSRTPEGPYAFSDVSLPPRDRSFWDGRMTHNPHIHRVDGRYILFYTATTYRDDMPDAEHPAQQWSDIHREAMRGQYVGYAVSDSPYGPWARLDAPIAMPRPGMWDEYMITNPAAYFHPDGRVFVAYKSGRDPDTHGWPVILKYGMLAADGLGPEFTRFSDEPLFSFDDAGVRIEDAFMWYEDGVYQMLINDLTGKITGEDHAGVHAFSRDLKRWAIAPAPKAYSRTVSWDDGSVTTQGSLERPQLLIETGRPTHLILATADGPGHFSNAQDTWTTVIRLNDR